MTERTDFDRMARAWLDLMPNEAPDRTIEAVLQAVAAAPQVRRAPRFGSWRPPVNRLTLIAAAAALLVAALGGAMLLTPGHAGPPASSPTPPATPIPAASPTLEPVAFPLPLWGDWIADAEPITGLIGQGPRIQLSFNWDGGHEFWVQTDYEQGYQAFASDAASADPGQIRLVSRTSNDGCAQGDAGTYAWARSADGLFLTLTLVTDPCGRRATTVARTWVRSLGAVNDGGPGMALFTDPYPDVQLTLPKLRWGMDRIPPVNIGTFDEGAPTRHLVIDLNPQGLAQPCGTAARDPFDIARTTDALTDYLRGLPGMTDVVSMPATIGGKSAAHITATSTSVACPTGELILFTRSSITYGNGGSGETKFLPGTPMSLWALVDAGDLIVFWYSGEGLTPADEGAVIDSIRFTNGLPTP